MKVKLLKPILGILVAKVAVMAGWYLWKNMEKNHLDAAKKAKEKFRFQPKEDLSADDVVKKETEQPKVTAVEEKLNVDMPTEKLVIDHGQLKVKKEAVKVAVKKVAAKKTVVKKVAAKKMIKEDVAETKPKRVVKKKV
jgi:hypothetical protein